MNHEPADRNWPDTSISPGDIIREELEVRGMTQLELARRMGRPVQVVNEIVKGKKRVTHDTALELERVLGAPAHVWVNLESAHQLTLARKRDEDQLLQRVGMLVEFPVREMEKRKWIPKQVDKTERLRELLRFLGVASFDDWRDRVLGFRITPKATVSMPALAVWLRKGEIDAREIETTDFDPNRFERALVECRRLTAQPPSVFAPMMRRLCAQAGVAVVFTPELPRSGASGAARWLTPAKAQLQLSLRYKSADQLWFSFFHEACHILRHDSRTVFVEGIAKGGAKEIEADRFATDMLVPPSDWTRFIDESDWSRERVLAFAQGLDLEPGIIVGRLQHERLIPFNELNGLKMRLEWVDH